ncbi:hypothetical protein [Gordonia sp. NPDC003422]
MSVAARLWDDEGFTVPGKPARSPQVAGVLLGRLHLTRAPHAEQVDGIREWLEHNHPSKSLIRSLERNGFGELV